MPSVLITGSNRGLGLEFAKQYAKDGWRVMATCREPAHAEALAALARSHDKLSVHALELGVDAQCKALAKELSDEPIDILLNNAGSYGPKNQSFEAMDYAGWLAALQSNVLGQLQLCQALLGNVERSERKLMVAVTSGMGSIADNTSGGSYVYRTCKAALNMVMKTVSVDLAGRGIIAVVINPGWVKTDMGGPRAKLEPEESISAMRKIFAGLSEADTGKFLNYNGSTYPW